MKTSKNENEFCDILKYNIETLQNVVRLDKKYEALWKALKPTDKRLTPSIKLLKKLFKKLQTLDIWKHEGKYCFFMTTNNIMKLADIKTASTANRLMNFLCAVGAVNKLNQGEKNFKYEGLKKLTDINKKMFESHIEKSIPMNFYYFKRYTKDELDRMTDRARRLSDAKITSGGAFGKNTLTMRGLDDIAEDVFPKYIKGLSRKEQILFDVYMVLYTLTEQDGYASREDIFDNLIPQYTESEIKRVLKIARPMITQDYVYKRPTKEEREKHGIRDSKFVYLIRTESGSKREIERQFYTEVDLESENIERLNQKVAYWESKFDEFKPQIEKKLHKGELMRLCTDRVSFDGKYFKPSWVITSDARVYDLYKESFIRPKKNKSKSDRYTYGGIMSHRLVANYFCDKSNVWQFGEQDVDVHHIQPYNSNKSNTENNKSTNLQWLSKAEHQRIHGNKCIPDSTSIKSNDS